MSKPQWVQPTMDHGAIAGALIHIHWVYGVGWRGTCQVRQEGSYSYDMIEVSKLDEGDAEALETWLRLVTRFIGGY